MNRRILAGCAALCIITAWLIRFIYINTHTEAADVINYKMGETVDYENDFFNSADENRNGYSIVVNNAAVYPYQKFADKMNVTLPPENENTFRADYVYDLEVTITNSGNTDGGIDMFNTRLIGPNFSMPIDMTLWELLYPQLEGSYTFKLKPGTAMEFHFPYTVETYYDQKEIDLKYLKNNRFMLNISNYPNKKMIGVDIE